MSGDVAKYMFNKEIEENEKKAEPIVESIAKLIAGLDPVHLKHHTGDVKDTDFVIHFHRHPEKSLESRFHFITDPACKMHIHVLVNPNKDTLWFKQKRHDLISGLNISLVEVDIAKDDEHNTLQLKRAFDNAYHKCEELYKLKENIGNTAIMMMKRQIKSPDGLAQTLSAPSVLVSDEFVRVDVFRVGKFKKMDNVIDINSIDQITGNVCLVMCEYDQMTTIVNLWKQHDEIIYVVRFTDNSQFSGHYRQWLDAVGHRFLVYDEKQTFESLVSNAVLQLSWVRVDYNLNKSKAESTKEDMDVIAKLSKSMQRTRISNQGIVEALNFPN
jgi:hypothetical protein